MATKKIEIDWTKVNKYLNCQCSGASIAGLLGIHENTLYSHCEQDHNLGFMAYSAQKKSEGKELLRAKQFETAMNGNVTMQIWLGKQYLGQTDKASNELTTDNRLIIEREIVHRYIDHQGLTVNNSE